jgi:hypothetical protein
MKAPPNGPGFDPRQLSIEDLRDPGKAEEALAHWDELAPALLTAIETHPQHGPRLAKLRRADRWLATRAQTLRPAGPCPSPEELYDYGRGPGYGPLSSVRKSEIERHLARCGECEGIVETLATPPPVPLEAPSREEVLTAGGERPRSGDRNAADGSEFGKRPARRRLRSLPRLVPLLVAASLILALGVWIALIPSGSETLIFPQAPLLRGSSGGPLFFPRDRVLHATAEAKAAFPALAGGLMFEIEPQANATMYRVDVARHGDDAFAAVEQSIVKLESALPFVKATEELAPGHYTWVLRVVVRGLLQEPGARDFEVVEDAELCKQLAELVSRPEPGRSLTAVRMLHEQGYLSDARAIARTMPPSRELDTYLGQVPGR